MTEAQDERRRAVRRLDLAYGRAYVIFSGDGTYSATRLDNGRTLTAGSPDELARKLEADSMADPVAGWALEEPPR
jgi:hypothetical protein